MSTAPEINHAGEQCPCCPAKLSARFNLLQHVRSKHRSVQFVGIYRSLGLQWCPRCFITYKQPASFEDHLLKCDFTPGVEVEDETLTGQEVTPLTPQIRVARKRIRSPPEESPVFRRARVPTQRPTPTFASRYPVPGLSNSPPRDSSRDSSPLSSSAEYNPLSSDEEEHSPMRQRRPINDSESSTLSGASSPVGSGVPDVDSELFAQNIRNFPTRAAGPCPKQRPLRSLTKKKREVTSILAKGLSNLLHVLEKDFTEAQKNHAIYLFNLLPSVFAKPTLESSVEVLTMIPWILEEGILRSLLPPVHSTLATSAKEQRVEELVRAGLVSKALSTIESDAKVVSDLRPFQDTVDRLHPPATANDRLPFRSRTSMPLQISRRSLTKTLQLLPKGSAVGFSAWTFELLKTCCLSKTFMDSALRLLNLMAAGQAGHVDNWWSSRLIGLTKKDGGIRPIAISDAWVRLLGRAINGSLTSRFQAFFAPIQLGVGTPGGSSKIANACQLACKSESFANSQVLVAVDFSNAFNSINRRAIATVVRDSFPELESYFAWAYGSATPLVSEGVTVARSATGVRQGDPLGPAFFCMGLHDLLQDLAVNEDITVLGYMDDITILGPTDSVCRAFGQLTRRAHERGLHVNLTKCVAFGSPSELEKGCVGAMEIPLNSNGINILGTPLGSEAFCRDECASKFRNMSASVKSITKYHPEIAYLLLAQCVNSRPQHLLRSVPPWILAEAALQFDDIIDQAIKVLCQCSGALPAHAALIRALPIRSGGLGMRSASTTAAAAWASSWFHSLSFMASIHLLDSSQVWSPEVLNVMHKIHPSLRQTHSWTEALALPSDILLRPQREYSQFADESARDRLMRLLLSGDLVGGKHLAAWFVSNDSPGTGAWLFSALARTPALQISGDLFRECLRLRLLLPAAESINVTPWTCQCSVTVDERLSPFHCFTCKTINAPRIFNHEQLRNHLLDFVKALSSSTHRINHSTTAPLRRINPGSPVLADMVLSKDHWTRYVDVSIANPGAEVYVSRGKIETPLIAATEREVCKANKYSASVIREQADLVVPFVVETTGRFGNRALSFIDELCDLNYSDVQPNRKVAKIRRFFVRRVQTTVALGMARARMRWRSHCSLDPPTPGGSDPVA